MDGRSVYAPYAPNERAGNAPPAAQHRADGLSRQQEGKQSSEWKWINTNTPGDVPVFCGDGSGECLRTGRRGREVLIESVPAKIEKPVVLTVVRQALQYREWTIVAQDPDSVSAKIARSGFDAEIRIRHAGDRLVYESAARGRSKLDYTGRAVANVVETPSRWIDYLRSDIAEGLQKPPSADAALTPKLTPSVAKEQAPAQRSSVQRMQELKEMFDRGLISADEYAQKKEQILKEL